MTRSDMKLPKLSSECCNLILLDYPIMYSLYLLLFFEGGVGQGVLEVESRDVVFNKISQ